MGGEVPLFRPWDDVQSFASFFIPFPFARNVPICNVRARETKECFSPNTVTCENDRPAPLHPDHHVPNKPPFHDNLLETQYIHSK